jgi:hypothetical protein
MKKTMYTCKERKGRTRRTNVSAAHCRTSNILSQPGSRNRKPRRVIVKNPEDGKHCTSHDKNNSSATRKSKLYTYEDRKMKDPEKEKHRPHAAAQPVHCRKNKQRAKRKNPEKKNIAPRTTEYSNATRKSQVFVQGIVGRKRSTRRFVRCVRKVKKHMIARKGRASRTCSFPRAVHTGPVAFVPSTPPRVSW